MKSQQQGSQGRDRGRSRLGSQADAPGMEQHLEQGFRGSRGQGPEGGQGHHGSSARLSDRGSDGHSERGPGKGELGSHSGARRNRSSRGPSQQ